MEEADEHCNFCTLGLQGPHHTGAKFHSSITPSFLPLYVKHEGRSGLAGCGIFGSNVLQQPLRRLQLNAALFPGYSDFYPDND